MEKIIYSILYSFMIIAPFFYNNLVRSMTDAMKKCMIRKDKFPLFPWGKTNWVYVTTVLISTAVSAQGMYFLFRIYVDPDFTLLGFSLIKLEGIWIIVSFVINFLIASSGAKEVYRYGNDDIEVSDKMEVDD